MTLNDIINNIEEELRTIFRDMGVKDINFGDLYKSVPQLPAVNVMLVNAAKNDMQVFQRGKIGWDLNFDVSCMFAGMERAQTFKNSRTFVNRVYDVLESANDSKLNNTVFSISCDDIQYGKTALGDTILSGGVVKLVIKIHEVR